MWGPFPLSRFPLVLFVVTDLGQRIPPCDTVVSDVFFLFLFVVTDLFQRFSPCPVRCDTVV